MKLFWLILKVLAIFITVGPLVGLVAFATGISALALTNGPADAFWLGPFFLIYGLAFAHFFGALWAFLAGLIAIGTAKCLGQAPVWIGPGSGIASFAVSTVRPPWQLPPDTDSAIGQQVNAFGPSFVVVVLLTHVAAATVCWLLTRRFARRELA